MLSETVTREYDALIRTGAFVDLTGRTRIDITGADRQSFLHNLCTNDIRRLQPGDGCEAFITSVQGKVLGHAYVFCGQESLVLDTVPGQAAALLAHFEKYNIREKIELRDRTADGAELLVAGADVSAKLSGLLGADLPAGRYSHVTSAWDGHALSVRRVDIVSDECFLIWCDADGRAALVAALVAAGFAPCGCEALAAARIEHGTPLFGIDITDKNLPQEVNRSDRAISFTKGCYLGQETVARIDALGHVNQTFCGVKFEGEAVPSAGLELFAADKPVGRVTSAAYSPRLGRSLALAYVRRGHSVPGTMLGSEVGPAEVVQLPVGEV